MRKLITATLAAAGIVASTIAPASAASFSEMESWKMGSEGIEHFVNSATCDFMKGHAKLMRVNPQESYAANRKRLMADKFVRDYMSKRLDQGAGAHAKLVPNDVRQAIIDLGIQGTLVRATKCGVIKDSAAAAAQQYATMKANGNNAFGHLTFDGVLKDVPVLSSAISSF